MGTPEKVRLRSFQTFFSGRLGAPLFEVAGRITDGGYRLTVLGLPIVLTARTGQEGGQAFADIDPCKVEPVDGLILWLEREDAEGIAAGVMTRLCIALKRRSLQIRFNAEGRLHDVYDSGPEDQPPLRAR
jgi:hypothetical protein